MKRTLLSTLAAAACVVGTSAHAQISDGIVKIGVLNDMSGLYSDITGQGSVVAAKFAVEDYLKVIYSLSPEGRTASTSSPHSRTSSSCR